MTRISPLEEFAKTTEDNYTSSVDGAAGYERMRAERDYVSDKPDPWDLYEIQDEDEDNEDDDEPECNCSDPGCPCGGHKTGGL